ncbi:hypothetical protein B0A55_07288 [Friedmanniomyces simplex]|uniref:F-box domain-containing protein n=1 Tax=Friedmanniomyces simplex TaxID=329884 RepID=A0A4U0WRQ3_9PEZI|nr:hypothetical protein B0A55_07288 [Friedmanniomyces simplex]
MCCRRRGNRSPVIVTLSKMAIDKYQDHKAEKRAIARGSSPDPNFSRIDTGSLPDVANNEILEKAGIAPPSYDEVMVSQPAVTPERRRESKQGSPEASDEELAGHDDEDSEVLQEVSRWLSTRSRGQAQGDHEDAALSDEASAWLKEQLVQRSLAEGTGVAADAGHKEDWRTRWQREKAERAGRRAEGRVRAMASLLELSHELLHCIFAEVDPADLAALTLTCHDLNSYIRGNRLLHKDVYVRRYDEPRCNDTEPDWEKQVQDLTKLERLLESENKPAKLNSLGFVADQIMRLVNAAHRNNELSSNLQLLIEHFHDTTNVDAFLCSSTLFDRAGNENQQPAETEELRQASAKLHCLFGVPIDVVPSRLTHSYQRPDLSVSPSSCTRLQMRPLPTHTYARSKVYDLRQYTEHTLWGPFMDDGSQRVDWEKVEAVMVVLGFNLNKFTERSDGRWPCIWDKPFIGASPNSYSSQAAIAAPSRDIEDDDNMLKIRELALALDAQDPYGVTGTWMRVVCFLDYNDLYAFNFSTRVETDEQREPIDTEEGIIDLEESIKLQVTKIEPPGSGDEGEEDEDDGMDWSNFRGERLPVVHFRGNSRSLHASWDPNANSKIRGTVRQTPEGEIRWTTFSIFHGEERWRSEGIQVGGLRSGRGVLGNWFDKDYDIHGPAGPTAFWKITDELEEERSRSSSSPLAYY